MIFSETLVADLVSSSPVLETFDETYNSPASNVAALPHPAENTR